jgi:sugar phosphate isomerase/epimerase
LELFIKNLRPVVEYAEKMGVVMAIEPVAKHIVNTPARARKVLDAINSPNLQIILDPVNLLAIWNYQDAKAIVDEAIELLGDDVAMVHIKDFVVEDGNLKSVAAGFGEMDYTSLMKWMKIKKPFIHATLEDTNPGNNIQAKEYIQKLYDEA